VKRFKNILFVDGNPKSNRALRRAVDLARRNDSSLKVIEVIEDIPRGAPEGAGKMIILSILRIFWSKTRMSEFLPFLRRSRKRSECLWRTNWYLGLLS
jgi:nucleotide-binding universal stress UspA family protein